MIGLLFYTSNVVYLVRLSQLFVKVNMLKYVVIVLLECEGREA